MSPQTPLESLDHVSREKWAWTIGETFRVVPFPTLRLIVAEGEEVFVRRMMETYQNHDMWKSDFVKVFQKLKYVVHRGQWPAIPQEGHV